MVARRRETWWANLPEPAAAHPGARRPVLIGQADRFNRSLSATVIVASMTTNLRLAGAPGNLPLTRRQPGLPKDSGVNVSQALTIDRSFLTERVDRLPAAKLHEVDAGLLRVLGLHDAAGA